jgi:hypothetical protein
MIDLDEKMAGSQKHHLALVEEAVKRQRTLFTSYHSHSSRPTISSSTMPAPNPPTTHSSNSTIPKFTTLLRLKVDIPPGYRFPPKLTDSEHELLRAHRGCRVCRQLFADHPLPCNRLPPNATVYKPITPDLVNEMKHSTHIAAVNPESAPKNLFNEIDAGLPISAVVPLESMSFILGNGFFSMDASEVGPPLDRDLPCNAHVSLSRPIVDSEWHR